MIVYYKILPTRFLNEKIAIEYGENFILKNKKDGENWFGFTYSCFKTSWRTIITIIISIKEFEDSVNILSFKNNRPMIIKESKREIKDTDRMYHNPLVTKLFYRPVVFNENVYEMEQIAFGIGTEFEDIET